MVLHFALIRRATPRMAATGGLAVCTLWIGTVLTIAPNAVLGRAGMPRRYIDYPQVIETMLMLSTIGMGLATAALVTLVS